MRRRNIGVILGLLSLVGCSTDHPAPQMETSSSEERREKEIQKLFGEELIKFGGKKKRNQEDAGICVNSYLWRASLDAISFMPISSADPFGGVILTDWYSPAATPQERFKVNILILNRQLRSDGLKVSVFRQEKDASGQWVDHPVDPETVLDLENAIFNRARHFRSTAVK